MWLFRVASAKASHLDQVDNSLAIKVVFVGFLVGDVAGRKAMINGHSANEGTLSGIEFVADRTSCVGSFWYPTPRSDDFGDDLATFANHSFLTATQSVIVVGIPSLFLGGLGFENGIFDARKG